MLKHIEKKITLENYFDTKLDPIPDTSAYWYELNDTAA